MFMKFIYMSFEFINIYDIICFIINKWFIKFIGIDMLLIIWIIIFIGIICYLV